jgi:ferredoxin
MPAQIVVVKRSRRRAFAILRGAPAWWRAVFSNTRFARREAVKIPLEDFEAFADAKLLACERASGLRLPRLIGNADLSQCGVCSRCVEICPSAALDLQRPTLPRAVSPSRFELDPGRCIGCGDCARVCPAGLLEMKLGEERVGAGRGPRTRNLLSEHSSSVDASEQTSGHVSGETLGHPG